MKMKRIFEVRWEVPEIEEMEFINWMSGKRSNDFLVRFTGKIAVIDKTGQLAISEPLTPGLPLIGRRSQQDQRSTASKNERRATLNKSWGSRGPRLQQYQHETYSRHIAGKNRQEEDSLSTGYSKKPLMSVANNIVNNRELNRGSCYEEKPAPISWVFKDKETSKFFSELDRLPFAKGGKDKEPTLYRV